jgi:polar amino acid transport system permease protein
MDFSLRLLFEALPVLVKGAEITLVLAVVSTVFGIVISVVGGLARVSKHRAVRVVAAVYVVLFRGVPLLVTLLFLYYGLPSIGLNLDAFTVGVIGLSINFGAYASEIVRAGIQSIHPGQMRAARSLGMSYAAAMKLIILPQALRRVLAPMANEVLSLIKATSLVSTIAIAELLRMGLDFMTWRANTFSPFVGVALIYLILTLPMVYLVTLLEKRYRVT